MTDIALLFPPQWSPFQPPLSVPSLAAWLERDGFTADVFDANVELFQWMYTEGPVSYCKQKVDSVALLADRRACTAILESASDFAEDLRRLRSFRLDRVIESEAAVKAHFIAINSMELYLKAISTINDAFTLTPFSFTLSSGDYDSVSIEQHVEAPPQLLQMFVDDFLNTRVAPSRPGVLGLSCIGQEQLFFTLLFAKRAKQLLGLPVVIGGTIFSRIFERGALPRRWFGRYFDVIVRNEGEKPLSALLENVAREKRMTDGVPGAVFYNGTSIEASAACAPLKPQELPMPVFSGLPLNQYVTSELSLPLLSSRGCYWGKCEFCHHGMVYGEQYGAYDAASVLATVEAHSRRYGVRHFAFNDEAIPPKIARIIGNTFPDADTSKWAFTGLIKFEKFYTASDFANLRRVGFRSLYVGLESASERVLDLMKKSSKRAIFTKNLADASNAGIWMHCFLFFGFPGELEEDAQETYDFIMENDSIIGSFGCGTFSLEHNAPIFKHLDEFPIQIKASSDSSVNVYYSYKVSEGISAERAEIWAERLNKDAKAKDKYFGSAWIPREHLLSLLDSMAPDDLIRQGNLLRDTRGIPADSSIKEVFSLREDGPTKSLAINRANQRVSEVTGRSEDLVKLLYEADIPLSLLRDNGKEFYDRFVGDVSG
jgi:anaerobic magnesium-protoporphyrin IX monomethyl ester cyclase